ncbi:MAG: bifunctional phosphopantothenoylcysteine decarboxylase/phosphopantothenate--cysteine ligase CoaBC [Gammaproteobacteria bacterium]
MHHNLILGITGSIAAYKAAETAREFMRQGWRVKVVMTQGAQAFISPLTLQALTGEPVHTELLSTDAESMMDHIHLARWADHVLICPISAHFLAKLAHGFCDDLLSTLCLATRAPLTVAPAMNQFMWQNPATQHNLLTIRQRGITVLGPEQGNQACGDNGPGRLIEPPQLVDAFLQRHTMTATPERPHWIITAGPTREPIDPVRYLSNRSSGKMGYALAEAASALGARVTLISGPTALTTPLGIHKRINITTAADLLDATLNELKDKPDVYISAAAIADYRVAQPATEKIKKEDQNSDSITLRLIKNTDIINTVSHHPLRPTLVIGFAAETQHVNQYAHEKLIRKHLYMIIANDVSSPDGGFDSDYNQIQVIEKKGTLCLGPASKQELSQRLCQEIHQRWQQKRATHHSS